MTFRIVSPFFRNFFFSFFLFHILFSIPIVHTHCEELLSSCDNFSPVIIAGQTAFFSSQYFVGSLLGLVFICFGSVCFCFVIFSVGFFCHYYISTSIRCEFVVLSSFSFSFSFAYCVYFAVLVLLLFIIHCQISFVYRINCKLNYLRC